MNYGVGSSLLECSVLFAKVLNVREEGNLLHDESVENSRSAINLS